MILFYVGIFALCFWGIKFKKEGFFDDFLSKGQTNAIKGIFILFVFARHILQYIYNSGYAYSSLPDKLFRAIDEYSAQFIVVMFLFYSGYGVMESIKRKGVDYVETMPVKRIIPTIVNFDIAVLVYCAMNCVLGLKVNPGTLLFSFFGWSSIGNSNWYMFDIVVCYILVYGYFSVCRCFKIAYDKISLVVLCLFFVLTVLLLSMYKSEWWYNTLFVFFAGMIFSYTKKSTTLFLQRNYVKMLFAFLFVFALWYVVPFEFLGIKTNICGVAFAFMIVMLTMKVNVQNRVLIWLGENLFALYMYQRLSMIAIYSIDDGTWVKENTFAYMVICFVSMLFVAFLYRFWRVSPLPTKK